MICKTCGHDKPLTSEHWNVDTSTKSGLRLGTCKVCYNAKQNKRYMDEKLGIVRPKEKREPKTMFPTGWEISPDERYEQIRHQGWKSDAERIRYEIETLEKNGFSCDSNAGKADRILSQARTGQI